MILGYECTKCIEYNFIYTINSMKITDSFLGFLIPQNV